MIEINVCPSTLQEGFSTYSPTARRLLFDGKEVSHVLDFDSPNNESANNEVYLKNVGRISLSGVQPKASLVVDNEERLVKPAGRARNCQTQKRSGARTLKSLAERSYWLSYKYRRDTLTFA